MILQKQVDLFQQQQQLLWEILSVKETNLWKILLFDSYNYHIISTISKVKDLRDHNFTLYMNINEKRQQLHGVTALYIIEPTMDNVELIVKDVADDIYSSISLHFSSKPSNHILSTLAKSISKQYSKAISKVSRVSHSYIGYHVVDRTMALLSTEQEIVNFLIQFKNPPVIFYPKSEGTFANSLKDKIDNMRSADSFNDTSAYTAFIIVNRQSDYIPLLFHQVTYGALMSDIFQMDSYNQVRTSKQVHKFDINDEVWTDKKHKMISDIDLEREVANIKARQNHLKENMTEYSELTEKLKRLEWHLAQVHEVITRATERQLNNYSKIGLEIITTRKLSKQSKILMAQLLQQKGNPIDKLRLILLYMTCCDDFNTVEELEKHVEGVNKTALYSSIREKRQKDYASRSDGHTKLIKNLAKNLLKNILTNDKKFLVTRIAEQMGKQGLSDNGFQTLETMKADNRLGNIVVYLKGGCCLNEYQNILQYTDGVIYTGDSLVHASKLLG